MPIADIKFCAVSGANNLELVELAFCYRAIIVRADVRDCVVEAGYVEYGDRLSVNIDNQSLSVAKFVYRGNGHIFKVLRVGFYVVVHILRKNRRRIPTGLDSAPNPAVYRAANSSSRSSRPYTPAQSTFSDSSAHFKRTGPKSMPSISSNSSFE